jgi:hypothetical protein
MAIAFMKNMQALLPPGSSLAAMRPPAQQISRAPHDRCLSKGINSYHPDKTYMQSGLINDRD